MTSDYLDAEGMCFGNSGKKMYLASGESTTNRIIEYDLLDEDNYMPTKYVKESLKSVKTKGGTLLWQKK